MSCNVQFAEEIPFECLRDILSDIRGGTITTQTVKKGLWVVGCVIDKFDGQTLATQVHEEVEDAELADLIEEEIPEDDADTMLFGINPALVALLVELLMRLLKKA